MRKCVTTVQTERPQNGNKTPRRKHAICMPDNYGKNTERLSEYLKLIIVYSSMKQSVARQQSKKNPLFHFHGNTEHFILLTVSTTPKIKGKVLLRLYDNNGYANAPQSNVVGTLSILSIPEILRNYGYY